MESVEEQVRTAIEDIALRPDVVGLTHAKILRDEIVRLRSKVAAGAAVALTARVLAEKVWNHPGRLMFDVCGWMIETRDAIARFDSL
jgi:hypothetical protein